MFELFGTQESFTLGVAPKYNRSKIVVFFIVIKKGHHLCPMAIRIFLDRFRPKFLEFLFFPRLDIVRSGNHDFTLHGNGPVSYIVPIESYSATGIKSS